MIVTLAFVACGAVIVWMLCMAIDDVKQNRAWWAEHGPHGPGGEDSAGNVYCGCGEFVGNSRPSRMEDEIR
jgi:hypothetical protein